MSDDGLDFAAVERARRALPPLDASAERMVDALMPPPKTGRRLWSRANHDPGDEDRS